MTLEAMPTVKPATYIFLFLVVFSKTTHGQQFGKFWQDVNYANDTSIGHRMDIFLPRTPSDKHPAVLIVYGSAFFGNSLKHEAFKLFGKPLLNAGFAVVAVNHRSSRDTIFPAQIHDIKAAIRFVRAKATDYHIDTSFIGITGYSSGGHLSAFAGTSGGVEQVSMGSALVDLEGKVGVHTGYNSAVNAVVDWFGPTDFLVMDSCGSAMVHNAPDSPESILVGGAIQAHQELCSLANPITYVDSNDPAFLILHGDKDPLVPYCQSEMLHSALLSHKVQSQLVIIADAKHGPGVFEPQYLQRMVDFFILQMR